MSTNCLSSLVNVRGCEASDVAFYINDLPGVTIGNAADTATDSTGIELLKKCIDAASRQIKQDVQEALFGTIRINEIIDPFEMGIFYKYYQNVSGNQGYEVTQLCDDCRLASTHITAVEFQPKDDFEGKVVLKIGNVETEYPVEVLAGNKAYVAIDKIVNSDRYTIHLEKTGGGEYQLLQTNSLCLNDHIHIQVIGQGNIRVVGNRVCDIERLFCETKQLFGNALFKLSGVQFYVEAMVTDRLNYWTVYNSKEQANIQKGILKSQYEKSLKNIIVKLKDYLRDYGGCCTTCTGSGWTSHKP